MYLCDKKFACECVGYKFSPPPPPQPELQLQWHQCHFRRLQQQQVQVQLVQVQVQVQLWGFPGRCRNYLCHKNTLSFPLKNYLAFFLFFTKKIVVFKKLKEIQIRKIFQIWPNVNSSSITNIRRFEQLSFPFYLLVWVDFPRFGVEFKTVGSSSGISKKPRVFFLCVTWFLI